MVNVGQGVDAVDVGNHLFDLDFVQAAGLDLEFGLMEFPGNVNAGRMYIPKRQAALHAEATQELTRGGRDFPFLAS